MHGVRATAAHLEAMDPGRVLEEHFLREACVFDFKAAPERVDPLATVIQRELRQERRFPASRRPRQDRELPAAMSFDDLVESRQGDRFDALNRVGMEHFG